METIHILQKTYEQLYVARIPLINYLSERLPVISPNWKRDCVERVLNENVRKDFSELDLYYLIQILQDDKNKSLILEVFPGDSIIFEDNNKLFNTIKKLRCDVMHPSFEEYTYKDFVNWTNQIESFVRIFDSEKGLADYTKELHKQEKDKLLDIIKSEVLDPAINSSKISDETKKNIENTKNRLEIQDSAEGIIAFFTDALHSNQGQKIRDELERNGLNSFEKIEPIVLQEYYS